MITDEMAFDKIQQAVQFFRQRLAAGPQPSQELYRELQNLGISQLLAKRAERRLGVLGYQRDGRWWLSVDTTQDKGYRSQKGVGKSKGATG
jgi:hypothetical protein